MRLLALLFIVLVGSVTAQESPYVNSLPADPPYYRVRYEGSEKAGELVYPVSFTIWIPPQVTTLRGVVVHQHGCGEGSCKSGQTGAFDLHWQALARKHDCALLSPVYEQPEMANCQLWCDPRNGSDVEFQKALVELGDKSKHPELATVPWALWGHSGGGHWAGGMTLLHPDRVIAAWLRSGVPPIIAAEGKPAPYSISEIACQVPVMCNLGTREGVTDKASRFAGVWPGNEAFFLGMRARGALIGVSIDPLSSHDCGNQRYLAMPWFEACLTARLPAKNGEPLKPIANDAGWLAPLNAGAPEVVAPVPASKFTGDVEKSVWLPSETVAAAWTEYMQDSVVTDTTPPPAPTNLHVDGNVLTWSAEADLESGLASFIVERDGQFLANVPDQGKNPFGRPIFQNLSYSDTPAQPLAEFKYVDIKAEAGKKYQYEVIAVNTVGLKSTQELPEPPTNWKYPFEFPQARVEVYRQIGDATLNAWIFEPKGHTTKDPRPAIIFFFGGGWNGGTPGQFLPQCLHLAERGMVAITVDYRVKSRHGVLPQDCVRDAKAAVRWVRANAQRLGVDPDRIAASGGSAGGHLAAAVALVPGFEDDDAVSSMPNALVLFNPAVILAPVEGQPDLLPADKIADIHKRTDGRPQEISPYHFVRKGMPPSIIFHGTVDEAVPFPTVVAFQKAMSAAGNRCELKAYEGQPHGFFNPGRGQGASRREATRNYYLTLRELDAFLESLGYLKPVGTE